MSTLADAWKCDASNVTWLVDRLEEHGLAERRPHPTDRRVRTVALTRKGAQMRAQIESQAATKRRRRSRDLSADDLETLDQDPAQARARTTARSLPAVPRFLTEHEHAVRRGRGRPC